MLLRVTGHEAHVAFDGVEALEQAVTIRPDIVLLDLQLPRWNGYEACRRLRETPATQGAWILALTGMGDECAEPCRAAGFDGLLTKPVDYDELMSRLAMLTTAGLSGTGTDT